MNWAEHYPDASGHARWDVVAPVEPRLPALLDHIMRHFSERELVVWDDGRATYGEVVRTSERIALRLLAAGLGKGSRIGFLVPNGADFLAVWWAISRVGAVAVPISTLSTANELARVIRHADLALLIAVEGYLSHDYVAKLDDALDGDKTDRALRLASMPYLRGVWFIGGDRCPRWATPLDVDAAPDFPAALLREVEREVVASDPAIIIYTSGSTAEPKGVIHTHDSLLRASAKLAAYSELRGTDRVFSPQQFFWVGGLTYTVLRAVFVGATILTSARNGARLLDFIQDEGVTFMTSWPHQARALAADPSFSSRCFPAMRAGELVEALPPELRPADPGAIIMPLGMTETCGPHGVIEAVAPPHLRGTCGQPMPGVSYRLVDPDTGEEAAEGCIGLLHLRGDTLFAGMVKRDGVRLLTPDGWYNTGDLCEMREGYLFYRGRSDDMIKASGANVSPREVEEALLDHPQIARAMVLGLPDFARGNVVGAIVVPKPGQAPTVEDLRRHAAQRLSAYKVPRVLLIVPEETLPMQHTGKLDRRRLVRLLAEARDSAAMSVAAVGDHTAGTA